jgi:sodium-dependent dicarboxylate transporter 2/3/5
MWMSNTATAMMMLPIVFSYRSFGRNAWAQKLRKFDCNIAWVAYGCSIGGIATLVNLLIFLCQDFEIIYPNAPEISFGQWLIFALPLSLIMFVILAVLLYYVSTKDFEVLDKSF